MLNIASWGAERQVLMGEKTVLCGESHVTRLSMDAIQSYDTELRLSPLFLFGTSGKVKPKRSKVFEILSS